ncbi:MAG: DUF4124 domain-containing protein [Betaproteobacteria bacterium]
MNAPIPTFPRCRGLALAALLALAPAVEAQVYKCIDGAGRTTYQQTPCPAGAKGGRVDLVVNNGSGQDPAENQRWQGAVQRAEVMEGMPRRFVEQAVGAPAETRPGRADENAFEVWTYPRGNQVMLIGITNGIVVWVRQEYPGGVAPQDAPADGTAPEPPPAN